MIAASLRKIESELLALAAEGEPVEPDAVRLVARRIAAQAEMLEEGLGQ